MAEPPVDRALIESLRRFWDAAEAPADRRAYLEFQARRYGAIIDFLGGPGALEGRRVLDLGGGVGSLAVALRATLGGTYHLAEYAEPDPRLARALAGAGVAATFRCDLSRPDPLGGLPDGYDTILFVEVLEHLLVNPLLVFRSIYDHLALTGTLFLTTPNLTRLTNRVKLLLGRSIKERGRFPPDGRGVLGHVAEYSRPELDYLLRAESFRRLRSRVIQQIPSVNPTLVQRLGVRFLNLAPARHLELGDDILASYAKVPRPATGCPVPLDASGRV